MKKEKRYNKPFISVEKYRRLTPPRCKNCQRGNVYGGTKRDEAKRVGKCFYCSGSGDKQKSYLPKELYAITEVS